MVKEAIHRRLPDSLRPFFPIDAESLDQYIRLLIEAGGRVVYGVLDIDSQHYRGLQRFQIGFESETAERTLRFRERHEHPIHDITDYHFSISAALTAQDRLSRLAASIPGIVTRLSIHAQDGLPEIDLGILKGEIEQFDLKPFPMPEAASQESR